MDPPQRATAAQMASRNIKNLNKQGKRRVPIQSQTPVFLDPNASSGGLFGGGIAAAPSGFNFSMGSAAPSLSFGATQSNDIASNNQAQANTGHSLFFGDDRGGKRQFGGAKSQSDLLPASEQRTAQPTPGTPTQSFPSALGQSFSVNWPGQQQAGQSPAPNNAPSAPGTPAQNFTVKWPGQPQESDGMEISPPSKPASSIFGTSSAPGTVRIASNYQAPVKTTPFSFGGFSTQATNSPQPTASQSFGGFNTQPAANSQAQVTTAPLSFGGFSTQPITNSQTPVTTAPMSFGGFNTQPTTSSPAPAAPFSFTGFGAQPSPVTSTESTTVPFTFGVTNAQQPPSDSVLPATTPQPPSSFNFQTTTSSTAPIMTDSPVFGGFTPQPATSEASSKANVQQSTDSSSQNTQPSLFQQQNAHPSAAEQPSLIKPVTQSVTQSVTEPNIFAGQQDATRGTRQYDTAQLYRNLEQLSSLSDEAIAAEMPPDLDENDQHRFRASFRLRTLNTAASKVFGQLPINYDPVKMFDYCTQQRHRIMYQLKYNLKGQAMQLNGLKMDDLNKQDPPETTVTLPDASQSISNSKGRLFDRVTRGADGNPIFGGGSAEATGASATSSTTKGGLFDRSSSAMDGKLVFGSTPVERTQPEGTSATSQASTPAAVATPSITNFSTRAPLAAVAPSIFSPPTSTAPLTTAAASTFSFTPQTKRKLSADDDSEDQENRSPSKRSRNVEQSIPQPPKDNTMDSNTPPSLAPAPSSSKGKRRAEDELTQKTQQLSPLKRNQVMPNQNNSVEGQSQTSNILRKIVDTPRKTAPLKSSATPTASSNQPVSNPFGSLMMPTSSKEPSLAAVKSPGPSFPTSATSSSLFASKSAPPAVAANPFQVKSASAVMATTGGGGASSIKPPIFGSAPVNFLAQFGQKASADEKDNEAKLMEKAKAEDMDSDDDEAEWEAEWKAKRTEELKKLKDMSKSKKAKFVAGKGFVYDNSEASDPPDSSVSMSSKATPQEVSGLFNAPNPSRASTPGLRSSTGSVLDRQPGQSEKGYNIFEKLASSKEDNEKNEGDSSDGDNDPEDDTENIDPSHQPSGGFGSRPFGAADPPAVSTIKPSPFGLSADRVAFGSSAKPGTVSVGFGFSNNTPHNGAKQPQLSSSTKGEEPSSTSTTKKSLFDRVTKPPTGTQDPTVTAEDKENKQAGASTTFGGSTNIFGSSVNKPLTSDGTRPGASIFSGLNNTSVSASNSSAPANKTWTPSSPIKFATPNSVVESPPMVNVTAATPPKSDNPSIFGSNKPQAPFAGFGSVTTTPSSTTPFKGLFGTSNSTQPVPGLATSSPSIFGSSSGAQPTPKPTGTSSSLFGSPSANPQGSGISTSPSSIFGVKSPTPSLFGSSAPTSNLFGTTAKPATTSNVGFAFGSNSATSSLFPSVAGSADTSRATSPAGTTDNESGAENDPDAEKHEQINLAAGGPGEEDENVTFEVRAKLMKFNSKAEKAEQWPVQGLGPLRLLKHKETGVARIVMRADPSGKLLLNKGILPGVTYESNLKTMRLPAASADGKSVETYLVQVKDPAMATKLAEELNANKDQ